jgi:DNA-binding CsgD family transcriptional regulator
MEIELVLVELQHVALPTRLDPIAADELAQRCDMALYGVPSGLHWPLAPESVDRLVHRDDFACSKEEKREQRALLRSPRRHVATPVERLESTQNAELHVEGIVAGNSAVSGRRQCRVSGVRHGRAVTRKESQLPVPELSPIEEQVVFLAADGQSSRTIADELGLSLKTVEWHLARAGRKLDRAAALRDRVRQPAPAVPPDGGAEWDSRKEGR